MDHFVSLGKAISGNYTISSNVKKKVFWNSISFTFISITKRSDYNLPVYKMEKNNVLKTLWWKGQKRAIR